MFADDMLEILESFVVEVKEIFETLDVDLVELERTPKDQELLNRIFRAVHTVKGTAGFLSFESMSVLTHRFEDVLNRLRRGELTFHTGMMDVMLAAFDQMKVLLAQVESRQLEDIDLSGILDALSAVASGASAPVPAAPAPAAPEETAEPAEDAECAPEPAAAIAPAAVAPVEDTAPRKAAERQTDPTIRVDVARLDSLMNLVGELVLARNRLAQMVGGLDLDNNDDTQASLVETSAQIDFITTELQSAVMKTRMVPIGRIFSRFPRLIRDLAKEFGKDIDLVTTGEETELDKSVVEEIADPLVHLIRNAADHGVEQPEARRAAGKPVRGQVRLHAAHEGNHVVVEIEDDGYGMDPEKLRQMAVKKGLMSTEEAAALSRAEVYNLIFAPGFSTAARVSSVSGRGVGMDVVKTNITRLNGTVSIDSEPGRGSKFTIRLPLTLAIFQGLLVEVSEETFALPLHAVHEVVGVEQGEVSTIHGREVIQLRERVLPLVRIGELLDVPEDAKGSAGNGRMYAVVLSVGHHTFGVAVDRLLGQKEIVIKPLGDYLRNVRGIAGSTILGDGRVVMILDPAQLVELVQADRAAPAQRTEVPIT